VPSSFTPEDGTGLEDANAYADLAYVDDYHRLRANTAWSQTGSTEGARRAAIIKATDFIEHTYGRRFIGQPATDEQALHWPASGAYVDGVELEGVPEAIKRACAEYALRALTQELAPDNRGGSVGSESQTGGGISYQINYAAPGGLPRYPAADRWLDGFLLAPAAVRA
jgi:hypothetical protein